MIASCQLGRNIIYPGVVFDISQIGDAPPFAAGERIRQGENYSQEIQFDFRQGANSFKTSIQLLLLIRKPYREITIDKMIYSSELGSGTFLENAIFELPNSISSVGLSPGEYFGMNGFFWTSELRSTDRRKQMPLINFQRVFPLAKPDDQFIMNITINYHFESEPQQIQSNDYLVRAVEGHYVSPFQF